MTKGDFVSLFLFLSLFISSFPSLNFFNFSGEPAREALFVYCLGRTERSFLFFHKFPSHDEAEAAAVPPRAEEAREGKRAGAGQR